MTPQSQLYRPAWGIFALALFMVLFAPHLHAQNVGIGTTTPAQKLDVEGYVELGDESIGTAGTAGAIRYNTTFTTIEFHDGTAWQQLGGGGWQLTGNAGTAPGTNFLGTTDANGLSLRTNSTEAIRVNTDQNVGIGTGTPTARLHVETPTSNTSITEQHVITNDGPQSVSSTISLPADIVNVTLDLELKGDFNSTTTDEFVNLFVDGVLVQANAQDGNQDCTLDPAVTGLDVTSEFQGKGSVTLQTDFGSGVDLLGCADNIAEWQLTITTGDGAIRIVDGSEAAGNVLTSDANGNATWQDPNTLVNDDNDWSDAGTGQMFATNVGDNVSIGTNAASTDAKLQVDNNGNDIAVRGEGNNGPTLGYLGVQGATNFDGNNDVDIPGDEIGVLGVSIGGSATDNFGVYGIANHWGGRFEHETSGNFVELGGDGTDGAIRIVDGTEAAGRVLTSDANGNATWQAPTGGADNDWTGAGSGSLTPSNAGDAVGIGTATPTADLHVNGGFRYEDGNEADGFVMKSDANGNATWERQLRVDGASAFFPNSDFVINNSWITVQALQNANTPLDRRLVVTAAGGNSIRLSYRVWDTSNLTPEDQETVTISSGNSITINDVSAQEVELLATEFSSTGQGHVAKFHGHGKINGWIEGIVMEGDF